MTIKHRDTLGYYVEHNGIQLTQYTNCEAKAEAEMRQILVSAERREMEWEERLRPYREAEERKKKWIAELFKKHHARRFRKYNYYDKQKAVAMAMELNK